MGLVGLDDGGVGVGLVFVDCVDEIAGFSDNYFSLGLDVLNHGEVKVGLIRVNCVNETAGFLDN